MIHYIENKKLFVSIINLFFFCVIFSLFSIQKGTSEVFSNSLKDCKINYNIENTKFNCYLYDIRLHDNCESSRLAVNMSTIKTPLSSTVNLHQSNFTTIWKSKVQPIDMPQEKYHNIGEPSIASNGTYIFYTGNHYAAKSIIGGNWNYVDPSFDFKGTASPPGNQTSGSSNSTNANDINLFKADQRTIYDPSHHMYIWIRLGETYFQGGINNIERLAISHDAVNWTVFDFKPRYIFTKPDIIDSQFDYPETIISKDYLYLTSSLIVGEHCEKEYGTIIRVSLNDLNNSLNNQNLTTIPYYALLDRNVTAITPVDGFSNTSVYFGAHFKNNSLMNIYEWNEGSNTISNKTVPIAPWNNIHNSESCGSDLSQSDKWWCKANTSSRIRSAWLYNNSLNFLWNAVTTMDNGSTWKPYMDVATFDINKNMSYERKYHVVDNCRPWIFGASIPNQNGILGIIAYYVSTNNVDSNMNPYLNLAFGLYNFSTNKWDMMPLINSSASLPVKDKNNINDYNFGDFITIRKHPPSKDGYMWDAGAYVITGNKYDDVEPYFIMIK